ncbi:MAG: Fe-S cluster assembly protein SufD [Candidatus Kapaibacteriota bacterium]
MEITEKTKGVSMNFVEKVNKIFFDTFHHFAEKFHIQKRKLYLEEFNKIGLPTLKHEEWKYTNLSFLNEIEIDSLDHTKVDIDSIYKKVDFLNGSENIVIPSINGKVAFNSVKFYDGVNINRIDEELLFSKNGTLERFLHFYDSSNPFGYLNLALFFDALNLKIEENLEKSVVLIYYYDSAYQGISNSLTFIDVGENTKANIVVVFVNDSKKKIFANEFINVNLQRNSDVEINFVQHDLDNLILINNLNVIAESEITFKANTFSLTTEFVRNNLNLEFAAEHSSAFLNGIYLVNDGNFVDDHTLLMHNMPYCTSDENFRGILDGSGRAVFNGKIYVARNAQKTNAYQSNKNLLLSNEARVNTKPQLEIYADDVKCTHGATAGFLDQEMLFYIISRGIGKDKAKSLLLNSFVSENLEKVSQSELRNYLKEVVARKLHLEDIFFCSSIDELTKV